MGQDQQKPFDAETDDWVFSSSVSPGALLRREREKRGLSYSQISQQTRLRPRYLEAIENGEWDSLPAPTLVKGFIRSYARVLDLDEDRLLDLYREESGADNFSQDFVLPSAEPKRIWPYVVVALVVLLVGASAFYAWLIFSPGLERITGTDNLRDHSKPAEEEAVTPEHLQKGTSLTIIEEKALPTGTAESKESAEEKNLDTPTETVVLENLLSKPVASSTTGEKPSKVDVPVAAPETERFGLHLKGHVKERTWLQIAIDGSKPKEYVFSPSDKPEWKAEKGFELLIGNAGGIALEFNGKKMDNLGKQGQVIRIKLPEDENRITAED